MSGGGVLLSALASCQDGSFVAKEICCGELIILRRTWRCAVLLRIILCRFCGYLASGYLRIFCMDVLGVVDDVLSFEILSSANDEGQPGLMMAVPCRCGLRQADTLRISGRVMVAMRARSILPVDFPELTDSVRMKLVWLAERGDKLAVGEFTALGLFDSYFLDVLAE